MKKIALVGSAPSSVRLAPYHDPSWEIWGCSPGVYGVAARVDAWFELHRYEPGQTWFSPEYCQWMAKFPGPVYMSEVRIEIPNSQVLPVEALVEKYGPYFFTSSLSWMFAMAIEAGATTIGLWGVDMAACPSPDTKVLTADLRWVRADQLNVGDEILAFDEEAQPGVGGPFGKRMWRKAVVLRNDRITKPCYRLTLEDGRELVCSDEHKWLTYGENESRWVMAKDMVTPHHRADRPTRIIKLCDVWEEDKSWGAGYLAAALDGEGHITQKLREGDYGMLRVGFAQRENAMSRMVAGLMQERGFDFAPVAKAIGDNNDCQKYILRGGRMETLKFMGSIRPRRLMDKFDPTNIGMMQKEDTVAVVKAEFIGEQPVIGLTTSTGTFVAEGLASHNTEEYGYQRAGCQYFAMLAKARGIEVGVLPESDLLRPPPLYGISELHHTRIKILARRRELQGRLQNAQMQQANSNNEVLFLQGALDDLNWNENTWTGDLDSSGKKFIEPPLVPALVDLSHSIIPDLKIVGEET